MRYLLNPLTGKFDVVLGSANELAYDNTLSGLNADNVQEMGDELNNQNVKFFYPPSTWHNFTTVPTLTGTASQAANQVRCIYVYIRKKVKIDRVRQTITAATSGTAVTGIYKVNTSTFTATLHAQAVGTLNLASATTQELLFASEITLDEGLYLIGTQYSNAVTVRTIGTGDAFFGWGQNLTDFFVNCFIFIATYTGTLPASFSVSSLGDRQVNVIPHNIFKVTG